MKQISRILADYHKSIEAKRKWNLLYNQVFHFMMPERMAHNKSQEQEVFSSLGEQVAERFIQRIQTLITPLSTDWIDFELGYTFEYSEAEKHELKEELQKMARVFNVFKNTSNFDVVISEFYADLIAGTACLLLTEGTLENPLRFVSVPIQQVSFLEGPFSEISCVFRKFFLKQTLIPLTWRDACPTQENENDDQEIELLEATEFDYKKKIWLYRVIDLKHKKIILQRPYSTNPFIILRWNKAPGEIYGRGPGLKVLNDLKTLNKIHEYALRALAFTIPVFCASQEGDYDVNEFVFEPGAINPVPSNATQNPTITQLGVNQSPDLQNYHLERLEMEIKKNMFDTTIPNDPSRNLTATEIAERVSELQSNMNAAFSRLVSELIYPLIKRMAEILKKFGYINQNINLKDFSDFGFKFKIKNLIPNSQRQNQVQQILSALQIIQQFDPSQTLISKVMHVSDLIPELLDMLGVPARFVCSKEEIQKNFESQILLNN